MGDTRNEIRADAFLANAIEHLRALGVEMAMLEEIQAWMVGKSDQEVRLEIEKMYKQFRRTRETQAVARAEALLEFLNARIRVANVATVAAMEAQIEEQIEADEAKARGES